MEIITLKDRLDSNQNKRFATTYSSFEKLLAELRKRDLPDEIVVSINDSVQEVNAFSGSDKDLRKRMRKSQRAIVKRIEKELHLTPKNYYRTLWMALGMAFGVPLGVVFSSSFGNMSFIGIGMPMGMLIGLALGTAKDKKALEEGRQLDLNGDLYI